MKNYSIVSYELWDFDITKCPYKNLNKAVVDTVLPIQSQSDSFLIAIPQRLTDSLNGFFSDV